MSLTVVLLGGLYLLDFLGNPFSTLSEPQQYWFYYLLGSTVLAFSFGLLGWFYQKKSLHHLNVAHQNLTRAYSDEQASGRHTGRILETLTDGFFSVDASWNFADMNPQAEHILDVPRGDMIGRDARVFFEGKISDAFRQRVRTAAQEGIPLALEGFYEPRQRWFMTHVFPSTEGCLFYLNDISDRKRYEANLITAREKAEQLAQLKSTLMANLSHEIRTPLTSIIGFSSILSQEATGEHQEFAHLIEQNGQRLMETLNSVLDLAQFERGQLPYDPTPFDVATEVKQIVQLLKAQADNRGLYLNVVNQATDPMATLDRSLLSRVLNNIVGNAIKFTNEGGVTVTVGGNEAQVWIEVADTGIGISPSFMPYLFDEFRQEAPDASRSYRGSGLGLAISQRLILAMNGTIEVESTQHVGSSFIVRLPRTPPA